MAIDKDLNKNENEKFVESSSVAGQPAVVIANPDGSNVEASPSTLVAFVTDIPTAGTRVQLADNSILAGVLQAPSTNTGNVFIGGSDVSSTVFGAELQPGQAVGAAINNTNKIYIDAATNGDDVAFIGS